MKGIAGFVFVVTVSGALSFISPQAQAGWGPATVNCYSDGGRRSHCPVPWREARLARQDSRAPCVRGLSWGLDHGGIWVDDGCRGIFEDAAGYDDRSYRVDHYHHGDRDESWRRYDDRPRWTSDYPPHPIHPQPPIRSPHLAAARGGDGRIVSCDSNDNKRVFCRWPIGQGARLVEQTSRNDCVEGHSYGFAADGIWAAKGCRGKFNIGY